MSLLSLSKLLSKLFRPLSHRQSLQTRVLVILKSVSCFHIEINTFSGEGLLGGGNFFRACFLRSLIFFTFLAFLTATLFLSLLFMATLVGLGNIRSF